MQPGWGAVKALGASQQSGCYYIGFYDNYTGPSVSKTPRWKALFRAQCCSRSKPVVTNSVTILTGTL